MIGRLKESVLDSPLGYSLWSAPLNRPKVNAINRSLSRCDKGKKNILDIGCGPGTNASLFDGWNYLGVDLNTRYIDVAKAKFPKMRFEVANAAKLSINEEKFDVILINSLMHHLDDHECAELLERIRLLIAEKGSVIIQEPVIPEKNKPIMKFLMKQDRGGYFRCHEGWKTLFIANDYNIVFEEFYELKLVNLFVGWQMYSVILQTESLSGSNT